MKKHRFEGNDSSDSLRWINTLSGRSTRLHLQSELESLQEEIIKNQDAALAYFFAIEFPYKTYRMQKVVLDQKDAKYAFMFAQNVNNADIKALQNIVIESEKIKYITHFACFINRADKKTLILNVLESGKPKYIHMLLRHLKGLDANQFKNIILESGKPRYLFELAKHLSSSEDIAQIEDLIIKSGSFTYMRLFAEKIKNANVDKLEQAVLDSDNGPEIKKFASYVRRSKMKKFLLVI